MSKRFVITAEMPLDELSDNVLVGDVVKYEFDFTPWQEDNATITSVTWSTVSGSAAVSGDTLVSGVASANITFSTEDVSIILVTAITASVKKVLHLVVRAKDYQSGEDSYSS